MARYDHDIIVIGMGLPGMAVSAMGAEMGLNVCRFVFRRFSFSF